MTRVSVGPRAVAVLAVVWMLATGATGLDWGLPYIWHPDEKVGGAVEMIQRHSLDPRYFVNPNLHLYLVWAIVRVVEAVVPGHVQLELPAIVPLTHLDHPDRAIQFAANLSARALSVLCAAATVWWLWRGLRRHGEWLAALAAAALATSMGVMNLAHFATPEGLLLLLTVLTLGAFERLGRTGRLADAVLAGLVFGLTCSTKYTAVLLAWPLVWTGVELRASRGTRSAFRLVGVTGGVGVAAFFAGTPYAALHWSQFVNDGLLYTWGTGAPSNSLLTESRSWLPYAGHVVNAMGVPLALAGVLGTLWWVAARSWRDQTMPPVGLHVAWITGFYAFLGLSPHHAMRFVIPIVPSLCVMAAWLADRVWRRARSASARRVAVIACVGVFGYSAAYCAEGVWGLLKDPRYAAGAWLGTHLAPGVGVSYFAIESYVAYFDRPAYSVTYHDQVWHMRLYGAAFDAWRNQTLPTVPDVIVETNFFYDRFLGDARHPERDRLYRDLLRGTDPAGYREVARFSERGPWWLRPQLELGDPDIVVFARPGQTR